MGKGSARTANLLGAAAVAIADQVRAAASAAVGTSSSGTAALITLSTEDGLGVTELGQRIGLSQPAAARMVDTLEGQGLAERRRESARSVGVWLTRRGHTAADRALRARSHALLQLIDGLEPAEQDALRTGLEALLGKVFDHVESEYLVCRLCDRAVCVTAGAICPVGQAARDRQATAG